MSDKKIILITGQDLKENTEFPIDFTKRGINATTPVSNTTSKIIKHYEDAKILTYNEYKTDEMYGSDITLLSCKYSNEIHAITTKRNYHGINKWLSYSTPSNKKSLKGSHHLRFSLDTYNNNYFSYGTMQNGINGEYCELSSPENNIVVKYKLKTIQELYDEGLIPKNYAGYSVGKIAGHNGYLQEHTTVTTDLLVLVREDPYLYNDNNYLFNLADNSVDNSDIDARTTISDTMLTIRLYDNIKEINIKTGEETGEQNDSSFFMSLTSILLPFTYKGTSKASTYRYLTYRGSLSYVAVKSDFFSHPPCTLLDNNEQHAQGDIINITSNGVFNIGTIEEWSNLFNNIGIPWTLDEVEFITKPTNTWKSGWKAPQQPGSGGQETGGNTGGGDGDGYEDDDDVEYGDGSNSFGVHSAYALNYRNLNNLQQLLSIDEIWANWASFFTSPEDSIINLINFPFNVLRVAKDYMETDVIKIAYVPMIHTGGDSVFGNLLNYTAAKCEIDMGSFHYFGEGRRGFESFLDYSPYTSVNIYMPFLGYRSLKPENLKGRTLHLKYYVSFYDGSFNAVLNADGVPILIESGQIGEHMALSFKNYSEAIAQSTMALVGTIASASLAGTTGATVTQAKTMTETTTATGTQSFQIADTTTTKPQETSPPKFTNLLSTAETKIIGSVSGTGTSRNLPLKPFLVIETPTLVMPPNYNKIYGYQTNLYKKLNSLQGFTMCATTKLNIPRATVEEINEIKSMLESGIIL